MIVMKFGGTSVADAERIAAIAEIVRPRAAQRPIVVVSALGGVTDLLQQAIDCALRDELEALDPILARTERIHRWAVSGIEAAGARHDLGLAVDGLFEDLRQRLRSIRILGEGTPRAADALLAFGEDLSTRIIAASFRDRGLPVVRVDPREVMITDRRFGQAEPDLEGVAARCRERLLPIVEAGEIPLLGGFIGATDSGETTTLGRGGSDTSAAILGAAVSAKEIQIWTDVDGMMSADPGRVPGARAAERVTFEEAAELAFYGARVLHPACVAPAVRLGIPVRVLNSLRPEGAGTLLVEEASSSGETPVAVASREGVALVRLTARLNRKEAGFPLRVLAAVRDLGLNPDMVVTSEGAVTLVLPAAASVDELEARIGDEGALQRLRGRAILCVVGSALGNAALRAAALQALAGWEPDLVTVGASGISAVAVIEQERLEAALSGLHRQFFERSPAQ